MADILFLLHLPPPVHGSSVMGGQIRDSRLINQAFTCRYLNLLASKQLAESGKLRFSKLTGFVVLMWKLARQLILRKPDICYLALTTTGMAFFRDVMLIAMLKLFRVRRIYHLHNKGVCNKQQGFTYRMAYRFVFRDAKVILLSSHLYSDVQAFVSAEQVFYCPNGVPDAGAQDGSLATAARDVKNPTVRILFLSNLIESKGVKVLVAACATLKQRGVSFSCAFVGAEGDISAIEFQQLLVSYNLTAEVQYLGKKFGAEKQAIFQKTDIFALPTFYECFPLVLLEAMQYSLPVVSCPEGGIPDQVIDGETGFLVPQRDALALANRLDELISRPGLRARMSRAGRIKFEAEFTSTAFESRFVGVMEEALVANV